MKIIVCAPSDICCAHKLLIEYLCPAPEWGWGPPSDKKSIRVMETILDAETPDLAVLNGDLITGENTNLHNSTHYVDQIVRPLIKRKIPWASTYGNHDCQVNLSCIDLLLREKKNSQDLSLTLSMFSSPDAGTTNYLLPVYGSNKHDTIPALLLWFFDSKGGNKFQEQTSNGNEIAMPAFVDKSVVQWFSSTNAAMVKQYGKVLPSVAFVHIPVYAMAAFQNVGVDGHEEPGINEDNPLDPEAIINGTYTAEDIPFMESLVNTKGMMAVFSGHDHGNDWCFKWNSTLPGMTILGRGLFLCFGRHSGYGGYGKWTRGSRQLLLQEQSLNKDIETWIRLEDKTKSGWVRLNSTYGTDKYPIVKTTFT